MGKPLFLKEIMSSFNNNEAIDVVQKDMRDFRLKLTSICPKQFFRLRFLFFMLSFSPSYCLYRGVILSCCQNQQSVSDYCFYSFSIRRTCPLSPFMQSLSHCRNHTKWWRMKHVCNLFKDSSLRIGCPAGKHFRKRKSLVRIIQKRRGGK